MARGNCPGRFDGLFSQALRLLPRPLASLQEVGPQARAPLSGQVPNLKIAPALGKERQPPVGTMLGMGGGELKENSQVVHPVFPDPFPAWSPWPLVLPVCVG